MMISMDPVCKNVHTFKEWCKQHHRTYEIVPGRKIHSLEEATPWLTSYGYYIMHNWRESPCHFDSTGPIGCFLAHRNIWEECVTRNENIWVFEEGVYGYATSMFEHLDNIHPNTDLILGHTVPLLRMWRQNSIDKEVISTSLMSIDKIYFGTKCYRISPRFAARLLQNSLRFDTHVDTFICTESIRYADEFQVTRTHRNIVSGLSSGKINHSIDHSLLILCLLLLTVVLSIGGSIQAVRLYRRCRSRHHTM
jgi:GR25 family glycosyltransferase involved in LPS biosynthesis